MEKIIFVKNLEELNNFIKNKIIVRNKTHYQFNCIKCNTLYSKRIYKSYINQDNLICKRCLDKRTLLKNYGVDNPSKSKIIHDKKVQTFLKKYNVTNPSKLDFIKLKKKSTSLKNYGTEIPKTLKIVQDKYIKTCINRYGKENVFQVDKFKEKSRLTCLKKYGTFYYTQSLHYKNKMIELYGGSSSFTSKFLLEKFKKKYGVYFPIQNKDVYKKYKNTLYRNYGVFNPSYSSIIMEKIRCKYYYDNRNFDSKPELALYIYLKDNNINFEYQPHCHFCYICNNKIHYYFPDFKVEDEYWEIKGDQFFDKNGKMINPFDKSKKSNMICQCKYKCMLDNNIKILRNNDYIFYVKYVNNKYGNKYLSKFKKQKCSNKL